MASVGLWRRRRGLNRTRKTRTFRPFPSPPRTYSEKVEVPPPPVLLRSWPSVGLWRRRGLNRTRKTKKIHPLPFPTTDLQQKKVEVPPPPLPVPVLLRSWPSVGLWRRRRGLNRTRKTRNIPPLPFPTTDLQRKGRGASTTPSCTGPPRSWPSVGLWRRRRGLNRTRKTRNIPPLPFYSKKVEVPPPPLPVPILIRSWPSVGLWRRRRGLNRTRKTRNISPPPFPTTDLQQKGRGASTTPYCTGPPKVMALSRAMEEEERAEQDKEDKEHSPPSLPHHGPTAKRSRYLHHPFRQGGSLQASILLGW